MNHKLFLPYWQKGLYLLFMAMLIAGWFVSAKPVQEVSAASDTSAEKFITIEALIDGRSQLILRRRAIQWYHFDFSVPGRWGDINDPTIINGQEWFPAWPDVPDLYNYNCNCYSDLFTGIVANVQRKSLGVELKVLEGRGPVSIVEYPSPWNDHALVIEFNDNDYDAAAVYKIELVLNPSANKHNITVQALIDGRSQLIVQKDTVQWYHLDFAAPGRHEFVDVSTVINGDEWFPVWPDVPDAENRDCQCYSSIFKGIKPALRHKPPLEVNVQQGRGAVTVVEYPSKANDYSLIIEFDDNAYGGADTYRIEIVLR